MGGGVCYMANARSGGRASTALSLVPPSLRPAPVRDAPAPLGWGAGHQADRPDAAGCGGRSPPSGGESSCLARAGPAGGCLAELLPCNLGPHHAYHCTVPCLFLAMPDNVLCLASPSPATLRYTDVL